MNKDLLSGVVLLAVAGLYYASTGLISDSTLSDEVGAAGLPNVLTVLLTGLAVMIIARALIAGRQTKPKVVAASAADEADIEQDAGLPRAVGLLLLGAAYVVLLPFVGYVIAIGLLIGSVALYEGAARSWKVPVAAIGGAVFYWAVFVKLLGVHQPAGTIFQRLLS